MIDKLLISGKTYYQVLGVDPKASVEEIRKAYLNKVKDLHPDVNKSPTAIQDLQDINNAYDGLGKLGQRGREDLKLREEYDANLRTYSEQIRKAQAAAAQQPSRATPPSAPRYSSTNQQYGQYQQPNQAPPPSQPRTSPPQRTSNIPRLPGSQTKALASQATKRIPALGKASQFFSKVASSSKIIGGLSKVFAGLSNPIGWAVLAGSILFNRKSYEYLMGAQAAIGALFSSIGAGVVALIGAGIAAVASMGAIALGTSLVLISLFVFIINSGAYIVPPTTSTPITGPELPSDCQDNDLPVIPTVSVEWSSDGKYAFPMAWGNGISCSHWISAGSDLERVLATDIFPINGSKVPLVAYTSGTIALSVSNDPYGGKYIILRGDDGRHYYYAHMCKVIVSQGQRVNAGEVVGTSDQTGLNAMTTPEHLHFAINSSGSSFIPEGSGNVCPATDFQNKFGHTRCAPEEQCTLTR